MASWLDSKTLPGDSKARQSFALKLREGLAPEGVIADWGDFDGDYPDSYVESDHDKDVDTYYKNRRSLNISIT